MHLHAYGSIYECVKLKVVFAGSAMNLAEFEKKKKRSDGDRTDSFSKTGKERSW